MITGKPSLLIYFESIHKPYFAIFSKGQVEKGNAIFRNDKDEPEFDYITARQSFEKTLELLGYGDYTLIIDEKKNVTTRGANRVDFKIGLQENAAPAATPVAGIGGVSMEDVERKANEIADKRFQELMDKKELADTKAKLVEVEKELKEAEKKNSDPINKFLAAAAPHSEHIIAGIFGKPSQANVVLSGIAPDAVGDAEPEAQKTIEDFVQALAATKPHDWQNILKKLTRIIEAEPTKFETALTFL